MAQVDQRRYFRNLLLHFRPSTVPERTLRLTFTWGLGGSAAVLLFLLIGTGLLLKFVYEPVPAQAYQSILYLQNEVPFGQLLRNMHRWSGNGLMLVTLLHLLRVFYTAAYLPPRAPNWLIGLALFGVVIFSNFTGYLLPWDQIAYWAVTVSTSMLDYIPLVGTGLRNIVLGGAEPGQPTLMNFYALHTAILPAALVIALSFHFWRIRKANGLVIPRGPQEQVPRPVQEVDAMPHLVTREVTLALIVFAVVLLISMSFDAPLADQANPGLSPNPTKAPWYFMGFQELLMHFHPVIAVLAIPSLLLAMLIAIPFVDAESGGAGVWFRSRKGRVTAFVACVASAIATICAVWLDERYTRTGEPGWLSMLNGGWVTFGLLLTMCTVFYLLMKKIFSMSRSESIQALFTLLLTGFVLLTAIGVWFRGPGMQLTWTGF